MGLLDKYNHAKPMFNYDNEKVRTYSNLKEMNEMFPKQTFVIHALFINTKSRFGDAPVIIIDDFAVNAPQHLTETVRAMQQDHDLVEAINQRKIGFNIYSYNGSNGTGYSVNWVEL